MKMRMWERVQRESFPLWEIADAEPDYFEPSRRIRVKVKKPLGPNPRIKVKGNSINSGWELMKMPYFYVGKRRFAVREVSAETCAQLVRLKAKVRVPRLEEQHSEEIRKMRKREMRKYKKGRL